MLASARLPAVERRGWHSEQVAMIEVVALHPHDAERAQEGGADRLHVGRLVDGVLHCLEPAQVSAIVRSTDLPVRVTLRLSEGFSTQGGEFTRLAGLAADYLSLGVEGFAFGFLTPDLEVDVAVCRALVDQLGRAPWTFDQTFDHALDARSAWRRARDLPGLETIHTAGSVLGLASGLDELLSLADAEPVFATAAMAAGDVPAEDIPWLVRSGIQRLHLGSAVRPGGSWTKAHVDVGFVRSWRMLLDDAVSRLRGTTHQVG